MDLDAYVDAHRPEWDRLLELSKQRRLNAVEADQFLDLYQRTATHLSQIRSSAPDASVIQYLSAVLSRARTKSQSANNASWSAVSSFFREGFPAVLYRTRRWWIATAVLNLLLAWGIGLWVMQHPSVQGTFVPPAQVDQLVNHDFAGYYSQYAARDFAFKVWTNNAWVAAQCVVFGVFGVPVLWVLFQNTLNLGVMGGLLAANDRTSLFFGLILPHGMLELTAVFVAGGAGLRLFWSWIDPGPRTRASALAEEMRATVLLVMGLVVVLLVSGVIEAFVTPSGLPTWARIGIGALAEIAFLAYVFGPGKRAAERGVTGDVQGQGQTAVLPTAG